MSRHRLLWQIYPAYLLLILVSLTLVTGFATRRARVLHRSQLERELQSQALLLEAVLRDADGHLLPHDRIKALCDDLGRQLPVRLTVLLANGQVIGDSDEAPAAMDNHLRRPEVQAALRGEPAAVMRYSSTVDAVMLNVVRPIMEDGRIVMFARVGMPFTDIDAAIREVRYRLLVAGLLIVLLAGLTGLYAFRKVI